MKIHWVGYWNQNDGYGRFNTRMVGALQKLGVAVEAIHIGDLDRPEWMFSQMYLDWRNTLTISCCPPYMLKKIPGRQWLFSMTEGSRIPPGWVDNIRECNVERVVVPCQHNLCAFRDSGVRVPISVVPGGTDPEEFPLLEKRKFCLEDYRPYTFLTFADRGFRKGWDETRNAFYHAFGGKTLGNQQVRMIIKSRKKDTVLEIMKNAVGADARFIYIIEDEDDMASLFAKADCLVLPSRSEGWGMIHREAACSGLPVITQQYAGMDDGHTSEWAMVVRSLRTEPIPVEVATALGEWSIPDKEDIAQKMRYCFHSPETAAAFGREASLWIRKNQTWHHGASALMELMQSSIVEMVR